MDRGCDIRFRNSSFSFSILKGNGTGEGRDIFEPGSQVLDGRVAAFDHAGQLLGELVDSLRDLKIKILTKPSLRISTKIQLHNLYKTSAAKFHLRNLA